MHELARRVRDRTLREMPYRFAMVVLTAIVVMFASYLLR